MVDEMKVWFTLFLVVVLVDFTWGVEVSSPSDVKGEQIYRQECARCHGEQGQGSSQYPHPLQGERSVSQLAELIRTTMPEDRPGTLDAQDARIVAQYIYNVFYSSDAQKRLGVAKIEVSRLTAEQHRRCLADLVRTFRSPVTISNSRGLRGEYFSTRHLGGRRRNNSSPLLRTDSSVDFDFKTEVPLDGLESPHEYSIRWSGALLPVHSGQYEFMIQTDHAARLWLNNLQVPIIDAWVKSGDQREYRAVTSLIGGYAYPLKLEFSKANQGVDDRDKQRDKPVKPAFIRLLWREPGREWEIIPQRVLMPESAAEVYVCTTPFPPDDRSYGWVRGSAVSREWTRAVADAAIETTNYILKHLDELAATKADDAHRTDKCKQFCERFAEMAMRRPLTEDWKKIWIQSAFAESSNPELAVKRCLLHILVSPAFLHREWSPVLDDYEIANRLALALWDSIPDPELFSLAQNGTLHSRDVLQKQVSRMLRDRRAYTKLLAFMLSWLHIDHLPQITKDREVFPEFDDTLLGDLRESFELFLEDFLQSKPIDFRRLMTSREFWCNRRLASLYGITWPDESMTGFQRLEFPPDEPRAGVITHPYVMTAFSHYKETSPIHRGVLLARGILGLSLKPPPEAVAPLSADLHPNLTTRERVELQTRPAACMSCHGIINPLGFTLENYDALGKYRLEDRQKPVDPRGMYLTRDGEQVELNGPLALAHFLTDSQEVHDAFIEQLFHALIQQPLRAYEVDLPEQLREVFKRHNYNIADLIIEMVCRAVPHPRQQQHTAHRSSMTQTNNN